MGEVMKKIQLFFSAVGIAVLILAAVSSQCIGAPNETPDQGSIVGKWQRPDGGYVLEIKSIKANGQLDAAYYNPDPIHVAKAEVTQDAGKIKIYIELQDLNYPGSNYNLAYEPQSDQLKGLYYQAVEKVSYEIFFVRAK